MPNITIRAKIKLDEADYDKIVAFANRDDQNPELKDLSKLIGKVIEFNIAQILAQIAAAEAQMNANTEAKVGLFGADNKPLDG